MQIRPTREVIDLFNAKLITREQAHVFLGIDNPPQAINLAVQKLMEEEKKALDSPVIAERNGDTLRITFKDPDAAPAPQVQNPVTLIPVWGEPMSRETAVDVLEAALKTVKSLSPYRQVVIGTSHLFGDSK